jgi:hypothetical protein
VFRKLMNRLLALPSRSVRRAEFNSALYARAEREAMRLNHESSEGMLWRTVWAHETLSMRLPRMTIRRWMAAVLLVAAMLAVRDQRARMRRQQIEAEIEELSRALAEYRHKYGSRPQCRVTLPHEPSAPGP